MNSALQVFATRAAARLQPAFSSYRNFLIIASAAAAEPQLRDQVTALAQNFAKDGYTYIARAGQKEIEDDPSGVRYLPLREALPYFGLMTAVVVAGDPAWAARAAETYPDADIFLLPCATNSGAEQHVWRKNTPALPGEELWQGAA